MKPYILSILILYSQHVLWAQLTKLPTYAIQKVSYLDALKDTTGILYGGSYLMEDRPYEYKDSILFLYDSSGHLIKETIWRFPHGAPYRKLDSTGITALDTCRDFREHHYDSLGRKISIRYGKIYGSPHRHNINYSQPFPGGGPSYFTIVLKIDSMAYDHRGSKLFQRRYEVFDYSKQLFYYVVRPTLSTEEMDISYTYDALGRVQEEVHYLWNNNLREVKLDEYVLFKFHYRYNGNDTRPQSKSYPYYDMSLLRDFGITDYITAKDSLMRYDTLGRFTGAGLFGWPKKDANDHVYISYDTDLTQQAARSFVDSTLYLDSHGSYQRKFFNNHEGRRYHPDGRLYYTFIGDLDTSRRLCQCGDIKINSATLH